MKFVVASVTIGLLGFVSACGSKSSSAPDGKSSTDKTGTITVDGTSKACKTTTQLFPATKEYSVVCQDDNFGFVQVTFKDEASARTAQALTVIKGSISSHPDPTTIVVNFQSLPGGPGGSEVVSNDGAPGTATGTAGTVTLNGVVLKSTDNTTMRTVSAAINF